MVQIGRDVREVPRGKALPISAFVLLFIYAVIQLQTDVPSRFLKLDDSDYATEESIPASNQVITNVGTEVPIPMMGATKQIQQNTVGPDRITQQQRPTATNQAAASEIMEAHQVFGQKCTEKRQSRNIKTEISDHLAKIFTSPSTARKLAEEDPVKPCRNAFIDLGANVGDSMGKLIDSGFPHECPNYGRNYHARYNLTSGIMEIGRGNELITFARNAMAEVGRSPEKYCYVGVEGNPVFTERLQQLEARVMDTIPRPLRAAHFYTESVGAGVDGPTFLYLDTINTANNYWGSSILNTHQDAKKSAAENGNVAVKAPVMGLTLSTLLKRSVQKADGSHVIIKIDIEGGEYVVINEAIDTLCEFTKAGVRVDLMMETHSPRVTGQYSPDMRKYQSETSKRIPECGIRTGRLAGGSH